MEAEEHLSNQLSIKSGLFLGGSPVRRKSLIPFAGPESNLGAGTPSRDGEQATDLTHELSQEAYRGRAR